MKTNFRNFELDLLQTRAASPGPDQLPDLRGAGAAARAGREPERDGHRLQRARRVASGRERRLAKFRQNVARFRLYRLRFLQVNMRSTASFKIYQILKLNFLKFDKILQQCHMQFFAEFSQNLLIFQTEFLLKC